MPRPLLVLLAALGAAPAWAGQYVAGTTSGPTATSAPGGSPTISYGNGSCSLPNGGGGGNGTGTIGGTLKTVFTWVPAKDANGVDLPGDVPPASVVVMESCSLTMDAKAFPGGPSATASNGLDARFCTNSATPYDIYQPIPAPPGYYKIGSGKTATSSGTAPRILAGGQTVTVQCSPSGSCSTGSGPYSYSFSYSASVSPVTVSVAGVTKDAQGYDNILIGQGAKPTLSCGGLTPTSWQWSVEGGKFASWVVSGGQDTGTLNYVPSSEWVKSQPQWYWSTDQNSRQVTGAAPVTYNGLSIGTATGKRSVNVWPPYYAFANSTASRCSYGYGVAGSVNAVQAYDDVADHAGEEIVGAVGTPALFSGQGAGVWQYVQIAAPSRSHTDQNGNVTYDWPPGSVGLDNEWPYGGDPDAKGNFDTTFWSAQITYVLG